MFSFLKKKIPQRFQEPVLRLTDIWYRLRFGFTKPFILTDVYGVRFVVYPYTKMHIRWLLKHGMYSKEMLAMGKLITPNATVFDIGANVGIISALITKRFASQGKIYTFEPLPKTFQQLQETIVLNNFTNVYLYNMAVSNSTGNQKFYFENETSSELNSLGQVVVDEQEHRMSKSVDVQTITLDTFCTQHHISNIDFVKIDVEGFEFEALQGMDTLLKSNKIKYIQFEISEAPLKSLGKQSKPIFDLLAKYGYRCYAFNEKENRFSGPITDAQNNYDNYYASKIDLTTL